MKPGLFLGLALGMSVLSSQARAQTIEWRGGGFFTPQTAQCEDDGYTGTDYLNVRYRPRGIGDNGPGTRIAFFYPFFGVSFTIPNGTIGKQFRAVQGGGTSGTTFLYDAKMRFTSHVPAKMTASTPSVRIVGEAQNYGGTPGCTMAFDVNLTRRP